MSTDLVGIKCCYCGYSAMMVIWLFTLNVATHSYEVMWLFTLLHNHDHLFFVIVYSELLQGSKMSRRTGKFCGALDKNLHVNNTSVREIGVSSFRIQVQVPQVPANLDPIFE